MDTFCLNLHDENEQGACVYVSFDPTGMGVEGGSNPGQNS
jgi:hypothetical protein